MLAFVSIFILVLIHEFYYLSNSIINFITSFSLHLRQLNVHYYIELLAMKELMIESEIGKDF